MSAHNLGSLLEIIAYQNQQIEADGSIAYIQPIFSDATSVGTGKTGVTAHVLKDYGATDEDFGSLIAGLQTYSILGNPNTGTAICGAFGPSTDDLCLKWVKLSRFTPISAFYSANDAQWASLLKYKNAEQFKEPLMKKYSYIQYLRTAAFLHSNRGDPVIRPLFFEFPEDEATYQEVNEQFMLGDALKVSPFALEKEVHFPKGEWCSLLVEAPQIECFE